MIHLLKTEHSHITHTDSTMNGLTASTNNTLYTITLVDANLKCPNFPRKESSQLSGIFGTGKGKVKIELFLFLKLNQTISGHIFKIQRHILC